MPACRAPRDVCTGRRTALATAAKLLRYGLDRLKPLGVLGERHAAASVEFALIGPVFLFVACAILEFSLELLAQTVLDQAVNLAARQVELGNITTSTALATDICGYLSTLTSSCSSRLQTYVTAGSSFSGLTVAKVSNGTLSPSTFFAGTAGSDVLVQAAYTSPYFFGWIGSAAGSTSYTLLSTTAFQNEPY